MNKTFISRFTSLQDLISEMIENETKMNSDERNILFADYQNAVISFGNDLENAVAHDIETHTVPEMVADSDCYFDEVKSALGSIVKLLEDYCEQIYLYCNTTDKDIKKTVSIRMCETEGCIALTLRFGFLYSMEQITGDASFAQAVKNLEILGTVNGDYYPVGLLWQYSGRKYLPKIEVRDTAIVMQGPVKKEKDFTIESLYRYRYIYPQTKIVLSTWEGEIHPALRRKLIGINVILVENTKPDDGGPYNLRYQLTSSSGGIKAALSDSAIEYILKTRTDQRLFMPDFLTYFKNLLIQYPLTGNKLHNRLILLGGFNTMLSYPFRISDFLAFGDSRDIYSLYSIPVDGESIATTYSDFREMHGQRVLERVREESSYSIRSLSNEALSELQEELFTRDPESYISQTFYEEKILGRMLQKDDDHFRHYWNFVRDYTVMVDPELLVFYWYKYAHSYIRFNKCQMDGGLTHSVWLDMYLNSKRLTDEG